MDSEGEDLIEESREEWYVEGKGFRERTETGKNRKGGSYYRESSI